MCTSTYSQLSTRVAKIPPMKITVWLAFTVLGLVQVYQCAVPHENRRREDSLPKDKPPSNNQDHTHRAQADKQPAHKPVVNVARKAVKPEPQQKSKTHRNVPPAHKAAKEFPLNDIFFKGRETSKSVHCIYIDHHHHRHHHIA